MNKRIRKKRKNKKCIKIIYINCLKNQWSTNTPRWKRIKASGQKYTVRLHTITFSYHVYRWTDQKSPSI